MFYGYWTAEFMRLMCVSVMLAGITTESGKHFIYHCIQEVILPKLSYGVLTDL